MKRGYWFLTIENAQGDRHEFGIPAALMHTGAARDWLLATFPDFWVDRITWRPSYATRDKPDVIGPTEGVGSYATPYDTRIHDCPTCHRGPFDAFAHLRDADAPLALEST